MAEIERRWRADLEAEVANREGPRPKRNSLPVESYGAIANVPDASELGPKKAVVPALQQVPVQKFTFMNGVRFAVPLRLPAPITGDQVPSMLQGFGLETSHVEGPPIVPKAKSVVPIRKPNPKVKMTPVLPPAKRMRCKSSPASSVMAGAVGDSPMVPLAPAAVTDSDADADLAIIPLDGDQSTPVSPGLLEVAPSGAEDGDNFEGSELGSDLDGSESSEPEHQNHLIAENIQLMRNKERWRVLMQQGVVRIGNHECLFSTAHGSFDFEEKKKDIPLEENI